MGNGCLSRNHYARIRNGANYLVTVKTGDKKGAGTDSNVFIGLINENNNRSPDISLDCRWKDDFESGNEDSFPIKNLPEFGSVSEIELWRQKGVIDDDWFVEFVRIERIGNESEIITFPINRWVKADKKIKVKRGGCSLPQFDEDVVSRTTDLDEKRRDYQFVVNAPGLPPQICACPKDESFSNDYKWDIIKRKGSLLLTTKFKKITTGQWKTLECISELYCKALPRPLGMDNWKSDIEFGFQRLSGCNPTQLRICRGIPINFAVTDELICDFLEGMTISEAIEGRKLYIVDYTFLEGLKCTDDTREKAAPFALFYVNKSGELLPIAIQLFPELGLENPVFVPSDPEYTWMLAKMWFNNADASYHQACTHLGLTHLIMETLTIAAHRSLSPSHPVFQLLAPHFLYLIAINDRALKLLVSEGGWVDKCLTIGRIGMFNLIGTELQKWRMDVHGSVPNDLADRGVDDVEALPNYYYRDDAMLLWEAIEDYTSATIDVFYDSPEKITGDKEIQEFARTLSAANEDNGCGLLGVPGGGRFETSQQLKQTLTSIIFIGSVGHAAANFCQYDEYGFPPNYPSLLYGDPPRDKEPRTEADIIRSLPNKELTISILLVSRLLSERGTKPLGDFEVQYLFDERALEALERFRLKLKEIGSTIDERNKTRRTPYTYLHPSEVPNSISI